MINITNLTKYFGKNRIFKNLNLKINDRETLAIIGGSGCGKSVLLKHIIGIMKPDAGKIYIDDEDISNVDEARLAEIRKHFGMVFQGAALFDSLTIGENVSFALARNTNISKKEIDRIVHEKLALVGLGNIENMKPAELSGGMRKRVGIARAIAMEPNILLYDEPTTGLDPITADVINNLIVDLHRKIGITSVVVTHDMVSAYKISDRIAMMYGGEIVINGTPDEIKNTKNPVVKQFITGSAVGPITAKNGGKTDEF
ncbi:MAG: ABC transporter ATP-binding protein [Candidatus Firestonebacteria bacterium]